MCFPKIIRQKKKPKFKVGDLVRLADIKKTFLKSDTSNWSYQVYKIRETINDTTPS